jgi:hypothetical protein
MMAQNWLVKPRIMLLTSQRTDAEIAISQMIEHMHILIEVLTTHMIDEKIRLCSKME